MTTDTIASPEPRAAAGAAGYRYQYGDRPLDGYTIQRGAGRGGFGEVYYALSDSGREVALKVVHTYEQIELRGIGQCMNLKSPHLVTIFDLKYGNDGRPWVIMEFVNGPSLRELLDAAPSGLGVQKAAFFLREIGKGLTELHDCGIVHRDLKPANIFFENGYVKIGDYGLSKLISASQHSGQTVTVGTVHYMAPEIGVGRYDKGIDIYALGALLFEMLTGQVPYLGSSPAEVLMKHLNGSVDVSGLEEPFASVIRKAMAKDPADRYASVQEMVEAVFGAEHVRNSVSAFSPGSLTIVAGQAARKIAPGAIDNSFTPSDAPAPHPMPRSRFESRIERVQRRIKERCDRAERRARRGWDKVNDQFGRQNLPAGDPFQPAKLDPLRRGPRIALGAVVAALIAAGAAVVNDHGASPLFFVFFSIAAATTAMMLAWRLIAPSLRDESPWLMRIVLGGTAGIAALAFSMPFWRDGGHIHYGGTPMAILLALVVLDWPARLAARRAARVSGSHIVTAVLAGLILGGMCDGNPVLTISAVAGIALVIGLVCGWDPTSLRPAAAPDPLRPAGPTGGAPPTPPIPPPIASVSAKLPPTDAVAPGLAPAPQPPRIHNVPRGVRILWLILFIAAATLGLTLLAVAMFVRTPGADGESAVTFGFGCGVSILAWLCYRRAGVQQFHSWWSYLVRPLIQIGCVQAIVVAVSLMAVERMGDGETALAIFWTVLPAVILFVVTFYGKRGSTMSYTPVSLGAPPRRSVQPAPLTLTRIGSGLFRFVATVSGIVVLTAALLLTVAIVGDLPALGNSAAVDHHFARDMTRALGTPQWPELLRHIATVADFILALVATGLLLLPRRGAGPAKMTRGLIALGLAFGGAVALGRAMPDWSGLLPGSTPGEMIESIFESIRLHDVLVGAGLLVLATFVFLWSPNGRPTAQA